LAIWAVSSNEIGFVVRIYVCGFTSSS